MFGHLPMYQEFARSYKKSSTISTTGKKTVLLLEYSPTLPVGYSINLLKAAALDNPLIRKNYNIECHLLSATDFPFEAGENTHNRMDNTILCKLMEKDPVVVGFSVFVWNYNYFKRFTKLVRLMNPHCKIIWGGKLVENALEFVAAENPDVDCFCVGEGEIIFSEYLLRLLDPLEMTEPLPGTVIKVDGRYKKSLQLPTVPDLGTFPNPYVEGLIDPDKVPMANIETLRGCLYHCTFCDWGGKNYRTFSDDQVCKIIKSIMDQKFSYIFFMDSIFAMKKDRRKKFLQFVLDHYNGYSTCGFELWMEMIDEETAHMFQQLAKMGGLGRIEIGLQSTNEESLKIIKRPLTRARFQKCYHDLVRNAPYLQDKLQIDLIIGLPRETWDTFKEGFNFVFSLNPGTISAFALEIFPGSEMWGSQKEQYGLLSLDVPPYSLISTADMSANEIQRLTVLTWMFTSLRAFMRQSLFYLHHMCNENIFQLSCDFAQWCTEKNYAESWLDYGNLEDHTCKLVEYLHSNDFKPSKGSLIVLYHTIFWELAPLILIKRREKDFANLWRRPTKNEYPTMGILAATHSNHKRSYQALIWVDDLIEYGTHPESSVGALATDGTGAGQLIEIIDETYRTTRLNRQEFESAIEYFDPKDIFIAKEPKKLISTIITNTNS